MRKNKTVYILKDGSCYNIPEKAHEFMAFWQSELDKIPSEFMDSAIIEFEFDSDGYGCGYSTTSIDITYKMPESDIDIQVREQRESQCYQRNVDQKLMQYERLKKELNL
jgi:uncharacterized protein Usg